MALILDTCEARNKPGRPTRKRQQGMSHQDFAFQVSMNFVLGIRGHGRA